MKYRITTDIETRADNDTTPAELFDTIRKFLEITKRNTSLRSYNVSMEIVNPERKSRYTNGRD